MSTASIMFHEEHPEFIVHNKDIIRNWLLSVAKQEDCILSNITYIFLTDDDLLAMNREHLGHNYYTDIITFPLHDENEPIEADIFISIDRIQENADEFQVKFEEELLRVMVHGLLHLCGYNDQTESEQSRMREKEEECIALFQS